MTTPPRDRAGPGTPPVPAGVPQKGCSTEELRVWVIEAIHGVGKDATDLEVRAAARINEVQAGTQAITVRLDALETPTEAQRALRRRLRALEETDPATANERELRRVLGLK